MMLVLPELCVYYLNIDKIKIIFKMLNNIRDKFYSYGLCTSPYSDESNYDKKLNSNKKLKIHDLKFHSKIYKITIHLKFNYFRNYVKFFIVLGIIFSDKSYKTRINFYLSYSIYIIIVYKTTSYYNLFICIFIVCETTSYHNFFIVAAKLIFYKFMCQNDSWKLFLQNFTANDYYVSDNYVSESYLNENYFSENYVSGIKIGQGYFLYTRRILRTFLSKDKCCKNYFPGCKNCIYIIAKTNVTTEINLDP